MTKKDVLQKVAINVAKLPFYGGLIGAGLGAAGGAATGYFKKNREDPERKKKIFRRALGGALIGAPVGSAATIPLFRKGSREIAQRYLDFFGEKIEPEKFEERERAVRTNYNVPLKTLLGFKGKKS